MCIRDSLSGYRCIKGDQDGHILCVKDFYLCPDGTFVCGSDLGIWIFGSGASIIIAVCVIKMVDAIEDVFHGFLQLNGRLDLAGKLLALRNLITTAFFGLLIFSTQNIEITCWATGIGSVCICLLLNFWAVKGYEKVALQIRKEELSSLVKACTPLCLGSFLSLYIYNIPKYAIDIYCTCLLYTSLTFLSLTDCITLPLYYLDLNRFVVGGILAAAICTIVLLFKSRQYICFEKNQYGCKKVEILLCLFLLATALCRSISPDLSFDVKQGHVFWQTPGFVDNINENVFPAGFTFFFALGDRFFYYPRMILGYRLGTLANAWIMILSYLQTVYLLQNLVGEKIKKLRSQWGIEVENGDVLRGLRAFFVSEYFFALVAVMTYYAIADLGTYMAVSYTHLDVYKRQCLL